MKDKSIKQPWPRSARVTVWALSVILGLLLSLIGIILWQVLSAPVPEAWIVY